MISKRDDGGTGHGPNKSKKDIGRELGKALQDWFPSFDSPAIPQPSPTDPLGDPKEKP
jgi:hypothetical protein